MGLSDAEKKAIEDKQDKLDEIKAKIKAYNQIIDLKQRQGSTLATQIQSLEAQANKLELEINNNQARIENLTGEIGSLEKRIADKELMILSQRRLLSELMRSVSGQSSIGIIRLITEPNGESGWTLKDDERVAQTSGRLGELLEEIRMTKQELENEQTVLEHKKAEADSVQEQLSKQNDYLESTKDTKASLLSKTQSEVKKYNTIVDQLEEERDAIENEIESLESTKIGELNLKDMPAFKHGLLGYPVKKVTFSQGYGKTSFAKTSKFYGSSGFHNGLDFAMPTGTSVLAAADGKVVATGNNGRYAYGRWMAIDHGNGIVTMYGHLSSVVKSRGSTVKRGDTIAKSGSTGNSTGPHLHFTVFSAKSFEIVPSKSVKSVKDIPVGATVNPKNYLP
ncbi:MAG: peptidoglycan DD-metalloendopeptidase family protein [Candidatus Moranbacteria bacterium]|nr:peptidoglycan DD-metalloendopeptidase family protein [Candidatus Moranbacteria bacterium]MBP6034214.1 peptidoglycan DD-metalloendopeptidase family protein [Candidatus Moranbacteria bacterium]